MVSGVVMSAKPAWGSTSRRQFRRKQGWTPASRGVDQDRDKTQCQNTTIWLQPIRGRVRGVGHHSLDQGMNDKSAASR